MPTFCLLPSHKTSPGEGIYGSPHFPEVSAFIQIRKAPGRLPSASVEFQMALAQNNHAEMACF